MLNGSSRRREKRERGRINIEEIMAKRSPNWIDSINLTSKQSARRANTKRFIDIIIKL
jgi:hypothetical protein